MPLRLLKRGKVDSDSHGATLGEPTNTGYILDYAATKGAIAIFTKALAKQVANKALA